MSITLDIQGNRDKDIAYNRSDDSYRRGPLADWVSLMPAFTRLLADEDGSIASSKGGLV